MASVNAQVAAGFIAAVATILVVVIQKQLEKKREIEQQNRQKKIPIYESFMEKWFEILQQSVSTPPSSTGNVKLITTHDFKSFLVKFSKDLVLWGNPKVIKEYVEFWITKLDAEGNTNATILEQYGEVLLEIRKELGHSNKNLCPSDLVALFIEDLDSIKEIQRKSYQ